MKYSNISEIILDTREEYIKYNIGLVENTNFDIEDWIRHYTNILLIKIAELNIKELDKELENVER